MQNWNSGNQEAAIEGLRSMAESGERAPLLLLTWLLSQRGQSFWGEGIGYAHKAAELGMPQALTYYFPSVIGDPTHRGQAPGLAREAAAGGWPLDGLPNALGVLQQGDPATAVALIEAAAEPRPSADAWAGLIRSARADLDALRGSATDIAEARQRALSAIAENEQEVRARRVEVETRSSSLLQLIERITNAEATSYFDEEARRYGGEARWHWLAGLAVLTGAGLVALTPILIYYYQRYQGADPWLNESDAVVAHATATLAFAAVAGVLLARARGRDRARQRARDLAVALQTMFVYAEQIGEAQEQRAFIREMGRLVLEAFLRQEAPVEANRSVLDSLRSG